MRHTLSLLIFFLATNVWSQMQPTVVSNDSVGLSEIEITAARYPQNLQSLAAPLQIISSNKLQVANGDLSAALSSVPGVQLQAATAQTLKLTLRGIGSRNPYGTNRTRVYINNIPLTSGDGTSVFDDIELNFLSRVEITKGSYSAWHGAGMGGALRFVTRKTETQKFSAEAGITMGSFGLTKISGITFGNFKWGKISTGISRLNGDGYRQNSGYSRSSALLWGEITQSKTLGNISYLLMLSDVHAFTPSSIDAHSFVNNPKAAASNWLNVKGHKLYKRLLAGVKIDKKINHRWANMLLINTNTYDQYELRPFNILDDKSVTWSVQESVRYTNRKTTAAIGIEMLNETYRWQTQANNTMAMLTQAKETRQLVNVFASAELHPMQKLRISVAANVNVTHYQLNEMRTLDRPASNSTLAAKAILSPMVGIIYNFTHHISLYGSAGHGFSNPTVEESLNSAGQMNTALKPEQGWTIDVGWRSWFARPRISLQAALYRILLTDLLITKRPSEDVFFGQNAGSSTLRGMEISFNQQIFKRLTYSLSGSVSSNSFTNFTDNNISYTGKQLPGIPRSQLYSAIDIALPWQLKLHTAFRYNGQQFADDGNELRIKGWKTMDAGLLWETKSKKNLVLRTQLTVNNILNEKYASMILINAPTFGNRAPRYYYPALPRNFALNLQLRWK